MRNAADPTFHVGMIMDGNGRWATARGLNRVAGHSRGARRVSEIVRACPDLGITHLTLYAFSTENWRRPLAEVEALMRIFQQYIRRKTASLHRHGVEVRFIGMRDRIPASLGQLMAEMEAATRGGAGLKLTIAIDYGGRDELTRAVRTIADAVLRGDTAPEAIDDATLTASLDTAGLPDPDLIIRTSGEQRISNFLLWQGAYAEYEFPETAWPEFGPEALAQVVAASRGRERRFGATGAQIATAGR